MVDLTRFVKGIDRNQIGFMSSYEDMVDEDNPVRVIDAFVDSLDMKELGFHHSETKQTGRKPYNPSDLLKIYLYGYFNGIRSSRKLAKECLRNIEMIWLINGLNPDFRTISDFRKEHIHLVKNIFKQFSMLCNELGLYGKEIVAIDGSKFRASNARRKNYTKGKILKQIKHFEEVAQKYLDILEQSDQRETSDKSIKFSKEEIAVKIKNAQNRIAELTKLSEQVALEGEISQTDPDSRHMNVSNNGTDIAHNVQIAVDSKHHLVVVVDVTSNAADQGQLYNMAKQAKEELAVNEITVLADKGYGTGEELRKCEQDKITPVVSLQSHGTHTGNPNYQKDKFKYDKEQDIYICPQGQTLYPQANGFYGNSKACKSCLLKNECTKSKRGRRIQRGEYQKELDRAKERLDKNLDLYKQRQMIVEHPYGTIKRSLGYTYFLLRRNEKVKGESYMHFLIYNMKRVINIIGTKKVIAAIMENKAVINASIKAISHYFYRLLRYELVLNVKMKNGVKLPRKCIKYC